MLYSFFIYKKRNIYNYLIYIDVAGQNLVMSGQKCFIDGQKNICYLSVYGIQCSKYGQKSMVKMAENGQTTAIVIGEKQGIPVYATNPSIPSKDAIARLKKRRLGDEHKGLIIDGTSEILGRGTAVVYEWEEVDTERFVKLFLGGIKKASGLSKTGLSIFEVIYNQMRESPNSDRVMLSFYRASQQIEGLNERTYRRGVRELLEREIIFRSPEEGAFFVDIGCMFNGDRLAFVKGYHLKEVQPELPFLEQSKNREET